MATHELLISAVLLILVTVLINQSLCVHGKDCEVRVSLPWEEKIFLPKGSLVLINCTADTINEPDIENILEWSIRLPGREIDDRFTNPLQRKILNNGGFYELAPINTPVGIIQLVINNTNDNNGTVLRCANLLTGQLLQETTLLVHEPILLIQTKDIAVHSVNLTWNSAEMLEQTEQGINLSYSLKVVTNSSTIPPQSFQVHEPFYTFTAQPESSSPCEVYNFSITAHATYVGATYTGAGCSVPSPVLSRMLPSLPDISRLESTLKYSISTDSAGVTLNVSFMPASYCDSYPVTIYYLYIEGRQSSSPIVRTSLRNFISVSNLFHNQIYMFNVIVSNTVGNVTTSNRKIYTTDVQEIILVPFGDSNSFVVQCIFLTGSMAQGCNVVVIGESDIITINFTRNSLCAADILELTSPVSNYTQALGYDIEFDGSIGTLAVQGIILKNGSSIAPCVLSGLRPNPTAPFPSWLIGVTSGVSLLAAIFMLGFCILICCFCKKIMSSKVGGDVEYYLQVSRPPLPGTPPLTLCQQLATCTEQDQIIRAVTPIYDIPEKYTSGLKHVQNDNAEHMYHVLESPCYHSKPQYPNGTGNMISDSGCLSLIKPNSSPAAEQAAIYQDVAELCTSLEISTEAKRIGHNPEALSPPERAKQLTVPIYQEIADLSRERADLLEQNTIHVYTQVPSAGTNI